LTRTGPEWAFQMRISLQSNFPCNAFFSLDRSLEANQAKKKKAEKFALQAPKQNALKHNKSITHAYRKKKLQQSTFFSFSRIFCRSAVAGVVSLHFCKKETPSLLHEVSRLGQWQIRS
jgi:superfamily II RNA helicase